jgi:putrescine transport system ATP-binding protein
MMFQSYALFPHLSVERNIAFGLKQQGMPKDEIAARVAEMLSLVRLDGLAKRKPHQLSGGQRQRVALARAIAPRPKMLLLDEPLAALDKKLREETQWELMALQQQLGMTFLIVTHDQEEAMVTADRIAVMRAGQIVQMGRPADVYEAPNSRYVADFIGDVNIFEGRTEHADGTTVRLASGDSPQGFDIVEDDRLEIGSTAWLVVRPEKIQVHLDEPAPGPNRMAGKVADIGYLGDWTTYLVELDSGRTIRAARANATRFVDRPVDWDDQVWLTFARDAGVVLTQ